VLSTFIAVYLLLIALLFFFQRHLEYFPNGSAKTIPPGFHSETLISSDKTKFLTWFYPAQKGEKIILYFHGNAGNIGDRAHKLSALAGAGFGVLAISYRGYSGSEGKPSEAGFVRDGEVALQFLRNQGYQDSDIILFGESLGSGVSVQLAAKTKFYAVILESPFSSVVSVAQRQYWFVPVGLILKDKFESKNFAPLITSPVLIFHGTKDLVVPFVEGQKLFSVINAPKKFITVDGAGHLDFPEDFLVREIKDFLTSH